MPVIPGKRLAHAAGRWVLACALLAVAAVAWAQDASMTLYVFKKGLPQPNIEVLLDDQLAGVTNEQGVLRFDIPPGIRFLEIRDQDTVVLSQQLLVNQDEISQWIVNITEGLGALVDTESSAGGAPAVAAAAAATQAEGGPGTLSGVLISVDDGRPVSGARIFVSGQSRDLRTGDDGRFSIEVPAGEYSLSVLHAAHNTLTRDSIAVAEGETTELSLELTPAGSELPEFVVIEPYIEGSLASVLEERRTELAVANILGAEQISKAGDSDAAGALQRVTGLTLVGGRFIYVRGLGERYSSTLLNGANVPSPDPSRRVVPLDLFPTSIIQSIAVKKGYTGELPGEFGGGLVEIRTKSVPETSFLEFEFGLAYRDGTSFKDGIRYDGGGSDWTGRDDGTRDLPDIMAAAVDGPTELQRFNRFTGEGYEPEELELIGESLDPNYDVYEEEIDPNLDASIAGGWSHEFDDGSRVGFLASMEWKDQWLTTDQVERVLVVGAGDELRPDAEFNTRQTIRDVNFSSFFTTGFTFRENHELAYNWMLLRSTSDRAAILRGTDPDITGGERLARTLEWIEREMKANQLLGRHTLPEIGGLKVDWQWTDAEAGSWEPDRREYRYGPNRFTPEEDDFIFALDRGAMVRSWGDLNDTSESWNIDFTLPLELSDTIDLSIKTGLNDVTKSRDSVLRKYSFESRGSIASDRELRENLSLGDVIFDETIAPNGWEIYEATGRNDNYVAESKTDSWHVGLNLNIGDSWRFGGGFRNEKFFQRVVTLDIFATDPVIAESDLDLDDQFPFATATWILGDHQFRAGWAETTNRPDFKELADVIFRDPVLDRLIRGNPDLDPAFITHYDLRWDYYFNPGEFISFGVFLKEFVDPIEYVAVASADASLTTLDNAESAENFGFEFEFYKTLDFLHDWWEWGEWWGNVYLNTNYAWIESDITLGERQSSVQTNTSRPLQGQSPYVWNFQVGFEDVERDINAALLYNVFGRRIVDVGVQGAPDIYEEPRPSLDFVYTQGFGNWQFQGKLKNLLDPAIEITQGEEIRRRYEPFGLEASVSVRYTFQ